MDAVWQVRWLIPDGRRLLSPGILEVAHGEIVSVREGTDADAVPLGDVALIPGLINAHTHLEFSDLAAPLLPGGTFPDWIRAVIGARQSRRSDPRAAIDRGWQEARRTGTIAVGEIATADDTFDRLRRAEGRGVVFREVLGLRDDAVASGLADARRFLDSVAAPAAPLLRGLSPHAPYSLHPDLLRGLIELAAERQAIVAMHLAETREDLELLQFRRGGLADLLRGLGLWRAELWDDFPEPLDYLRLLSRAARALVVHGNYLSPAECDFLATQPQMSVVYCPRTHAAFGHPPHPWQALQERGVRVVVGTDSRASNPDLSLFRELQHLHAIAPQVSPGALLRMATVDAAAALGLDDRLGTLAPGRPALGAVVEPVSPLTSADWSGLFAPGSVCRPLTHRSAGRSRHANEDLR